MDKTEEELVLEELFGINKQTDAFEDPQEAVPQDSEPVVEEQPKDQGATPRDNDKVRYEYWQSEADKRANELAQAKAEAEYYKMVAAAKAKEEVEPEEERFPAPPTEPQAPAGYSMEEAMQDPRSESAKYVRDFQKWQQDMLSYSVARTEYLEQMILEQRQQSVSDKAKAIEEATARQAQEAQIASIEKDVMTTYKADKETARDFIEKMSDPKNLTVDNLWKLYQTVYGKQSKAPSQDFAQARQAGTFAPAPAMLPNGAPTDTRSPEDIIMGGLKQRFNQQNDW
jgi:hypothetical protein